jgi:hypothetical protein
MWENSLKNVESDNNKILYETLLDFLQRNGTYILNKPRTALELKFINIFCCFNADIYVFLQQIYKLIIIVLRRRKVRIFPKLLQDIK